MKHILDQLRIGAVAGPAILMMTFWLTPGCGDRSGSEDARTLIDLGSEPRDQTTQPSDGGEPADQLDLKESDSTPDAATTFPLPEQPRIPTIFAELPANTEGIVNGGDGWLYLSSHDGRILRVNGEGTVEVFAVLIPETGLAGSSAGMALGPDRGLYVCRYGADRIERVDLDNPGTVTVFLEDIPGCNSLAFDSDGSLYFTASEGEGGGSLGRWTEADGVRFLLTGIKHANGLALTPEWVYFTSTDPGSLLRSPRNSDGSLGQPEVLASGEQVSMADGILPGPGGLPPLFLASFLNGTILAWDGREMVVVGDDPDNNLFGLASLAWGEGAGFAPGSLLITNLQQPRLFLLDLGSR